MNSTKTLETGTGANAVDTAEAQRFKQCAYSVGLCPGDLGRVFNYKGKPRRITGMVLTNERVILEAVDGGEGSPVELYGTHVYDLITEHLDRCAPAVDYLHLKSRIMMKDRALDRARALFGAAEDITRGLHLLDPETILKGDQS